MVDVAVLRSETWALPLDGGDDRIPVDHILTGQVRVERRQPGSMSQDLPDGDRFLSLLTELGPVQGDRLVKIEQSVVDE